MIQPIAIGNLISYFVTPPTTDLYSATMADCALLLSSFMCTFGMHQYMISQAEIGFKMRVAVSKIIYSKVQDNIKLIDSRN